MRGAITSDIVFEVGPVVGGGRGGEWEGGGVRNIRMAVVMRVDFCSPFSFCPSVIRHRNWECNYFPSKQCKVESRGG